MKYIIFTNRLYYPCLEGEFNNLLQARTHFEDLKKDLDPKCEKVFLVKVVEEIGEFKE